MFWELVWWMTEKEHITTHRYIIITSAFPGICNQSIILFSVTTYVFMCNNKTIYITPWYILRDCPEQLRLCFTVTNKFQVDMGQLLCGCKVGSLEITEKEITEQIKTERIVQLYTYMHKQNTYPYKHTRIDKYIFAFTFWQKKIYIYI